MTTTRARARSSLALLVAVVVVYGIAVRGESFITADSKTDRGKVVHWKVESSVPANIYAVVQSSVDGRAEYSDRKKEQTGTVVLLRHEVIDISVTAEAIGNAWGARMMCDIRTSGTIVDHASCTVSKNQIFKGVLCSGTVKSV